MRNILSNNPTLRLIAGLSLVGVSCFLVECQPITFVIIAFIGGWLIGGLHIYVEWKGSLDV